MKEKSKNPTRIGLTVGIPAYNEEDNIQATLRDVVKQTGTAFELKKIIVYSDGSSDKTVERIRALNIVSLELIDSKDRQGLGPVQNRIMDLADSDLLIIFNADIVIPEKDFFQRVALCAIASQADLIASNHHPLPPGAWLESALFAGHKIRQSVFSEFRQGDNMYTCNGTARAFSKRFYKSLVFPFSVGEDMYSFLYGRKNNFTYRFLPENEVFIKLPDNLADHKKQSLRYLKSLDLMGQYFEKDFLQQELAYPRYLIIKHLFLSFFQRPVSTFVYLFVLVYVRLRWWEKDQIKQIWEISPSSKVIKYEQKN